jgi:hypothetical protein
MSNDNPAVGDWWDIDGTKAPPRATRSEPRNWPMTLDKRRGATRN